MKLFVTVLAAAFAGLANAQSACLGTAEAIPSCGQSCLTAAGSSYGCVFTDFACQCSNSAKINNAALTACVTSACTNLQDALAVSSSAQDVCSCVATAGGAQAAVTSNAAIPTTTNAIPVTGPAPTNNVAAAASSAPVSSAAQISRQSAAAGQTTALSRFTGGAPAAAGAGGLLAGMLGLLAAL